MMRTTVGFVPTVLFSLEDDVEICYTYDNLNRLTNRKVKNQYDFVISNEDYTFDSYINWHCTNECFNLDEFVIANCEYPGDWDSTVERV